LFLPELEHPNMSSTLKYVLDESELERVGKMGGEGVLEKLREEMEAMEMKDAKAMPIDGDDEDWEE
jgi:periodic tryptophan protein 1